ncbi:autoinducer 2 sensor kinase/phosphatase LuxQ [bacterium BMS3Abin03]|nr:autoinducer 2 sensor kinase/phosphatase LuxQ [bacterium BMS3Abin03]
MNRSNIYEVNCSVEELIRQNKRLLEQVEELLKERIKRQELEIALENSETRFHIIADNTFNWESWIRPDGGIIYVSPAFERITGYLVDDYLSNPDLIEKIIHPDDIEKFKMHLREEKDNTLEIFQFDFKIITQNREVKTLRHHCKPVYNLEGKFAGRRSSNTEISNVSLNYDPVLENLDIQSELLNEVFESISQPLFVINVDDYSIIKANKAAGEININDKPKCYEISHKVNKPCSRKEHPCPLEMIRKSKKPIVVEHLHYDKTGQLRFFKVYGYPILDKNGKLIRMIEHSIDITDLKKVKKDLNDSREQLKILFEYAPDAYYLSDLKGNFIDGNKAAEELTGYKKEELIGKNFLKLDLLAPGQKRKALKLLANNALGKPTGPDELVLLRKNGSKVITEIKTFPVNIKGQAYILGIARDITERKRVEEQIREQALYAKNNPDPVLKIKSNGTILGSNPAALKCFGQELEGMSIFDLLPGVEENLLNSIREDKPAELENEINDRILSFKFQKDSQSDLIYIYGRDVTDVKRANEALQESDEKIEKITEAAIDAIIMINENAKVSYCNKAAERMFGYTKSEMLNKNIHNLIAPLRYRDAANKALINFIQTGKGKAIRQSIELSGLKKDNTEFPIELSLSSLKIKGKWNSVGTIRDITERKESEKKMRLLEKSVVQNPTSIIITDKEGIIKYVNPKFTEISGYLFDEVYGKNLNILKPNSMCRNDYKKILKTVTSGKEWKGEVQNRKKSGELYWASTTISPVMDDEGNITHFVELMEDITEKKQLINKLKQSEEQFRNIYENSTLGIYRSTPSGKIILANPSFISSLGYSSLEEIKRLDVKNIYADKDDRQLFSRIIESERVVNGFETKLKKKDGSIIDVCLNAKIVEDENGNIKYYEGTLEDISIRKDAERELIAAKEKAVEMNLLKTSLLTNISHELRTPLIGIIGYAELLKEELKDEALKEMIECILISGNRLTDSVELILDLAMLESKSLKINFEDVNVVNILEEMVCSPKQLARKKGLDFKYIKDAPEIYGRLDVRFFGRVIQYVLDNAIKFTPQGQIEVRISADKFGVVQITDTGIGIPKNKIETIFEPFRQASEGYSRSFEGTGLGLTLAKKFIEILGGSISVKSEENKGSTFTIRFPLAI